MPPSGTISKSAAKYIPAHEYDGTRFCSRCSMWVHPNKCTLVRGHIEGPATCARWAKRTLKNIKKARGE